MYAPDINKQPKPELLNNNMHPYALIIISLQDNQKLLTLQNKPDFILKYATSIWLIIILEKILLSFVST